VNFGQTTPYPFVFQKLCLFLLSVAIAVVAARSQYGASSYDIDTYQQLQGEFY
jgi:hypothetical protein